MLVDRFRSEHFFNRLSHRKETFAKIIEYIDAFDSGNIIETGTLRIADNFEGDGQSTFIWNWFLKHKRNNWEAYSIDIDEKSCALSSETCELVNVIQSESLLALSKFDSSKLEKTKLLYLDSFDWSPEINLDSAFHHMCELATVFSNIRSGCLVVVDDVHGENFGKHFMVKFFFEKLGVEPLFFGYQVGWIKP